MQVLKVLLSAKLKILTAILFDKKIKYLLRNLTMFAALFLMIIASYLFFYCKDVVPINRDLRNATSSHMIPAFVGMTEIVVKREHC